MAFILAGAVLGLIIGMVSSWLVLPLVLQSWEARWPDPASRRLLPAALRDPHRLRLTITAIYRYVIPLVFACVGGMAAYFLFIADAP